MIFRKALRFATLLLVVGCGGGLQTGGAQITSGEIAQNGARSFNAPRAKTLAATVGALKTLGYQIAFVDKQKGVIKTAPKLVRRQTNVTGTRYAATGISTDFSRSYVVTVEANGSNRTSVRALPRVFVGDQDISEQNVWDLTGEHTLWTKLFDEIGSNL